MLFLLSKFLFSFVYIKLKLKVFTQNIIKHYYNYSKTRQLGFNAIEDASSLECGPVTLRE